MRKILLSVLAATTAATFASPAVAQRSGGSSDRDNASEERSERAQARPERGQQQRAQRGQRPERANVVPGVERAQPAQRQVQPVQRQIQPIQQVDRTDRRGPVPQASQVRQRAPEASRRGPNVNERGRPTLDRPRQAQPPAERVRPTSPVFEQDRRIGSDRAYRNPDRQRRVAPPPGARPDRMAPPPRSTAQHVRPPRWSTDWRRDRRHDWRTYRERNRTHFRVGIYFDPFGWNYHRFNIGWRLWPAYYSNHFWITQPQMYQLPYAPWPYRWVRYYNDVLLVDTMNGQVVDVIYDFFW